jgi:metal-sulfur cluster biosynthetic enzyme
MATSTDRLLDALRDVYDPCCRDKGISIVDMGLIRSIDVHAGRAHVELVLTTGWCPFAVSVLDDVRERLETMTGVTDAQVDVVWDEPWTTERLSESARAKLRFLPDPHQISDRDAYVASHFPLVADVKEDGHDR